MNVTKKTLAVCAAILVLGISANALEPLQQNTGEDKTVIYGLYVDPGKIADSPIPEEVVKARKDAQKRAADELRVSRPKQVLFGDTHVHTTYSIDAFMQTLPMNRGSRGAFPPADACDYARYVSALDFFVLTDHAENYTAQHWMDAKELIRQCNAVAGDPEEPDLVAFMGFEWTQIGSTAENHFGHHNVMFMGDKEDELPARPIAAIGQYQKMSREWYKPMTRSMQAMAKADYENRRPYYDFNQFMREMQETPECKEGVHTRKLPAGCFEATANLSGLYRKLDEWGFDTIVIPHGTSWGLYTPPNASWLNKLVPEYHDPKKALLIEVQSGHGNSEEYRDFRARRFDKNGDPYCPEPTADYLPSCWQAGEIVRKRCETLGLEEAACEKMAADTRQEYADVDGAWGARVVPGSGADDWLDAGQCRDCFLPAFRYRPGGSVQNGLAIRNLDNPGNPLRYRWGFISSSDSHQARPGTGFKEYDRQSNADIMGQRDFKWKKINAKIMPFDQIEVERATSFLYLGGLAAVHSEGRSREAIWAAMKRKEVYATSGDRVLLWFNLLNGGDETVPMGGEAKMKKVPRFEVRAVGAFKQLPGCPDYAVNELSPERLQKLGAGECYNPSDERKLITRIEVVRIRPQISKQEDVGDLIEDPWLTIDCEPDPEGCVAEFSDPDFPGSKRDVLYYVRAIQEPTPTVNGGNLRTEFDDKGNAIDVTPCYGDFKTEMADDCLAPTEERAWSSPIYIDYKG